jgi:N-acetylmuramoyl-L-alanine amidase
VPRDTRTPSATRIAVTLGAVVAAVMLAIWGATAVAGAVHGDLKPATPLQSVTSRPATSSAQAATEAAVVASKAAAALATQSAPASKPAAAKPKPVAPKPQAASGKYVVVIDPGHGGDLSGNEPVGPNDSTPHPKTAYGATGVDAHHTSEASIVLKIGLKLRPLLEKQGVKVIMVRTGPAKISNKDRAAIANNAHADLFLRLHLDGVDGSSGTHGISMQIPSSSKGWAPLGTSRKAGEIILSSLVSETGAPSRGLAPRSDLAGFNWCKVPTCLPEMGFLSNPTEANKLVTDSYQNTLAKALADGTMKYLATQR